MLSAGRILLLYHCKVRSSKLDHCVVGGIGFCKRLIIWIGSLITEPMICSLQAEEPRKEVMSFSWSSKPWNHQSDYKFWSENRCLKAGEDRCPRAETVRKLPSLCVFDLSRAPLVWMTATYIMDNKLTLPVQMLIPFRNILRVVPK